MSLSLLERSADLGVVRVLLVEDNDGDARLVELMLQGTFGVEIELSRALTLAAALESIDEVTPDCVVLDLGLPDAHGLEAVQQIKAKAPLVAVVVLTGAADGALGTLAVAAGAQDYLMKGNTVDETLTRSIRYAVVRKNGEDALFRSQQTLAEAQHIARLGSWELDLATDTMLWSDELIRLYGYPARSTPGVDEFFDRLHPDDAALVETVLRAALGARKSFDLDHRIVIPGIGIRWVRSQGRVESLGTDAAVWMRGTAQDITEQKSAEDALTHRTLHDDLTGLPNRALLLDRLQQALAKLNRRPSTTGLLFIDVDRFKVLNDSLGHAVGDQVLVAIASRLLATLRPGDTLARFGGDEFVLLCDGLTGESDAIAVATRIGAAMVEPLSWGGGELIMTVSIGIALTDSGHTPAESLLRDADAAMYRAKEDGRARTAVFVEPMRAEAIDRLDVEVALRDALTDGQLEVHYQPMVELPSGMLVGTEALVRWQHPTRGLVGPDEFIAIAEETGLIIPLGAWVLREAARQTKIWQQRPGCASLSVAVNLSAVQLKQPDLVDMVAAVLRDTALDPSSLELEITETVLMADASQAVAVLQGLKSLGVRLSVDDFGTGYSSLSRLKGFPVDAVKIDRSFVDGLGVHAADSAIVDAVIRMAKALNLETIAEGIETPLQLQELVDLGCTCAQGYLFAGPAPASDLDVVLDAGGRTLTPSAGHPEAPIPVDVRRPTHARSGAVVRRRRRSSSGSVDPLGTPMGWGKIAAIAVAVGLAYAALSQYVFWLSDPVNAGAGFWPAAGVTLAALLSTPRRAWLPILLAVATAEIAGDLALGYPAGATALWAAGNVIEPLVGAALIRRLRPEAARLAPLDNLVAFLVLGVIAGPVVGATIGTLGTVLWFHLPAWTVWPKYLVGDALGVLVVAPLVLHAWNLRVPRRRVVEAACFWAVLAAIGVLVFRDWHADWSVALPYLLIPMLIWVALRSSIAATAAASFVVAQGANLATARGWGPFAFVGDRADHALTFLQLYLGTAVGTALILAAIVNELATRRELGRQLNHRATHDQLTNLPNRARVYELLERSFEHARDLEEPVAVLFCDLDDFKEINDTLGHEWGDRVLAATARRLLTASADDHVVGRVGGDEFVVVCPNVLGGDDAADVASALADAIAAPIIHGGQSVQVTASIGVAWTDGSASVDEVVRDADTKMYAAKRCRHLQPADRS